MSYFKICTNIFKVLSKTLSGSDITDFKMIIKLKLSKILIQIQPRDFDRQKTIP